MKWRKLVVGLMVSLLLLGGCTILPGAYQAEPIEGWVVDAETGKPLEGVNIAASWELMSGGMAVIPVGSIMLMETVTDVKGRYAFPAWGPLARNQGALMVDMVKATVSGERPPPWGITGIS